MFQITTPRAPVWRDFADGVRIQLRFGPTEARVAAQRYVREALKADPTADPAFAFVVGCLIWGVIAWEGVGAPPPEDADGAGDDAPFVPADLSPELLAALLRQRPDIYDDLDGFFVGEIIQAMLEKNGSRPSPNGTSEAAPATAPDATGPAVQSANTKPEVPSLKPGAASGG